MPFALRGKPSVARLRRKGDLEGLRAALRRHETAPDQDGVDWDLTVETRAEAARALSAFDAEDVDPDLTLALGDAQPEVRLAALEAIEKLGKPVAVDGLVGCVAARCEGTDEISDRAVHILTSWHAEGIPESLVEGLLAPGPPALEERHLGPLFSLLGADPRGAGAHAALAELVVRRLGERGPMGEEVAAERVLVWLGPTAADGVLQALEQGRASPALLRAAGLLGDIRALEAIVENLRSSDPLMRRSAATAAGALKHTRAVPALLLATQDSAQPVRDAAAAALDRMGMAAVMVGLATLIDAGGGDKALEQVALQALVPAEAAPPQVSAPAPEIGTGHQRRRAGGLLDRLLGGE